MLNKEIISKMQANLNFFTSNDQINAGMRNWGSFVMKIYSFLGSFFVFA